MSARNPAPFDSHRFVKHMTEAGMPLAQAEALAEEQGAMVNPHLATRQDTGELKTGLAGVEHRLTNVGHRLSSVEHRLTNVEHDVGGLKLDVGELKVGLAVVKAELAMVKWMVSGVGFGMLLLLVQNFWPV